MNRRRLLKNTGVLATGGAAVGAQGCAHGPAFATSKNTHQTELPDPVLVDQIVRSIDRRLSWIDQDARFPPELEALIAKPHLGETAEKNAERLRLFKTSIRALYVTGRFIDLPDEIKVHPAVQQRIYDEQATMDEAVGGMTAHLESLGSADHRRLQQTLMAHPAIGEHLARMLDDTGKEDGIPFPRRMSVRATALDLSRRMSAQSPALTIDPYLRQVRKIQSKPERPDEYERLMAARMGEKAFWAHQEHLAKMRERWDHRLAQSPATPTAPARPTPAVPSYPPYRPSEPVPVPTEQRSGERLVSFGGKTMGYGAASVGVGLLSAGLVHLGAEGFIYPALFFGVTLGPILLIVGLLIVITGAIMSAAE